MIQISKSGTADWDVTVTQVHRMGDVEQEAMMATIQKVMGGPVGRLTCSLEKQTEVSQQNTSQMSLWAAAQTGKAKATLEMKNYSFESPG